MEYHPTIHHVAIIPDGNRRWARQRGLSPLDGHNAGRERGIELTRHARTRGIHTLTLWGLSTENVSERPRDEFGWLVKLFSSAVDGFLDEAAEDGTRIVHLGRKDRLPSELMKKIAEAEAKTKTNDTHVLNIALDYGGRDEIVRAVSKISVGTKVTEEGFGEFLDTAGQPYPNPDLIIRTSGEMRTSGFLPWQSDYAELYFEPSYFPDFTTEKFDAALEEFSRRKRNFGK